MCFKKVTVSVGTCGILICRHILKFSFVIVVKTFIPFRITCLDALALIPSCELSWLLCSIVGRLCLKISGFAWRKN